MARSLWVLLPAALTALLTVFFFVLWQVQEEQTRTLRQLRQRVEAIDQREQVNNRQLLEEQMGTLQQRQQDLDDEFSDLLNALQLEREKAKERERQNARLRAELQRQPLTPPARPRDRPWAKP
jgi:HAMP domain-containing protein